MQPTSSSLKLSLLVATLLVCDLVDAFIHVPFAPPPCPAGSRRGVLNKFRMSNEPSDAKEILADPFNSVSKGKSRGETATKDTGRENTAQEQVDFLTYIFGKPGELDRDLAMLGTSRRRFLTINAASVIVALGANFLGVTSYLLGLLPDSQGLDLLPAELSGFYPVRGWKRYRGEGAFQFEVPQGWLQDQAVTFANAAGPADRVQGMKKRAAPMVRTAVAFGPPKGDFKENVSVVKSRIPAGFTLSSLGEPSAAAQRLLDSAIAPAGSGKEATLLDATREQRGIGGEVYQFEYVVRLGSGVRLHNICAVAVRGDTLYSLTALSPEEEWGDKKESLQRMARSFKLV